MRRTAEGRERDKGVVKGEAGEGGGVQQGLRMLVHQYSIYPE